MGAALLIQLAVVVFLFGLISEQIASRPGATAVACGAQDVSPRPEGPRPRSSAVVLPVAGPRPRLVGGAACSAPGDGALLHFPLRAEACRAWRRGELPSWNPAIFSGDAPPGRLPRRAPSTRSMPALSPLPPFVAFQLLVLGSLAAAGVLAFLYLQAAGRGPGGRLRGRAGLRPRSLPRGPSGRHRHGRGGAAPAPRSCSPPNRTSAARSAARAAGLVAGPGPPARSRARRRPRAPEARPSLGRLVLAASAAAAGTPAARAPACSRWARACCSPRPSSCRRSAPGARRAARAHRPRRPSRAGSCPASPASCCTTSRTRPPRPWPWRRCPSPSPPSAAGSCWRLALCLALHYGRGPLAAPGSLALVFDFTLALLAGLSLSAQWEARREPAGRRLRAYLLVRLPRGRRRPVGGRRRPRARCPSASPARWGCSPWPSSSTWPSLTRGPRCARASSCSP